MADASGRFQRSQHAGGVPGTGLVDWPITYDELEPYYTKVDWELGVSGEPGPFDPPRSKPYPMPPLPDKSSGVLMMRGAKSLGLHAQAAPMAINSREYDGRPACQHCGFCLFFMCEFRAKSTSMAVMLPARRSDRPLRDSSRTATSLASKPTRTAARAACRISTRKKQMHLQRAKAVVLCANGGETPRLLLNSHTSRFPNGLANSSGLVGKYLMFNTYFGANAQFEHPLNEYKSVQNTRIVLDFYHTDPKRGFYGGGGIDARFGKYPLIYALGGLPPGSPTWGEGYARGLAEQFSRTMLFGTHGTSLPLETNSVSLDPSLKDAWGLPCMRVTYQDHPDDLKNARFLGEKAAELAQRGRRAEGLAGRGAAADAVGASARHVPDGQRSEDVGRRQVSSHARREESLHLRRQQHGHVVARSADDDDLGAGVSGGRTSRRVRETRRDLIFAAR